MPRKKVKDPYKELMRKADADPSFIPLAAEVMRQREADPSLSYSSHFFTARKIVNDRAMRPAGKAETKAETKVEAPSTSPEGGTRTIGSMAVTDPEDVPSIPKSFFKGRKCSEADAVAWVAENLGMEHDDWWVLAAECPSPAAWSLFQHAKSNAANRKTFFDIWTKLIPPTKELEKIRRLTTDGRALMACIAEWEFDEYRERKRMLRMAELREIDPVKHDPFTEQPEDVDATA